MTRIGAAPAAALIPCLLLSCTPHAGYSNCGRVSCRSATGLWEQNVDVSLPQSRFPESFSALTTGERVGAGVQSEQVGDQVLVVVVAAAADADEDEADGVRRQRIVSSS